MHVSRSLKRAQRQSPFTVTIGRDFPAVIRACSDAPRPEQEGTWIEERIVEAYTRLHEAGDAHSVEAWEGGQLAGGVYGVDAGGVFTGESMFHHAPDASKLALLFLIDHLRARGAAFLDAQVTTPHLTALGAREIPRGRFLDLLEQSQRSGIRLFGEG